MTRTRLPASFTIYRRSPDSLKPVERLSWNFEHAHRVMITETEFIQEPPNELVSVIRGTCPYRARLQRSSVGVTL
jgi:hypothetical protein